MPSWDLYHGTNGDNILQILRQGVIKPNSERKIFFSQRNFTSVLMHGADAKRKSTFAVKLRVTIPPAAARQPTATPGVSNTLIVTTAIPLRVQVLELYVRAPRATSIITVKGARDISKYLSG